MGKIFAVYKPKGPTSHDIIDWLRKITGEHRIGHAGTLDPLASGVLVVGVGRDATRKLSEAVKKEKEYIATIILGATTTTDDAEGKKTTSLHDYEKLIVRKEEINDVVKKFIGVIQQVPPIYSALKIGGQAAYKLARRGRAVELKPRTVEIKDIKVLKYRWPCLILKVVTGPGVYIRALARDIGRALGVGGYLGDLERIRVGDFTKKNAKQVKDLGNWLG